MMDSISRRWISLLWYYFISFFVCEIFRVKNSFTLPLYPSDAASFFFSVCFAILKRLHSRHVIMSARRISKTLFYARLSGEGRTLTSQSFFPDTSNFAISLFSALHSRFRRTENNFLKPKKKTWKIPFFADIRPSEWNLYFKYPLTHQ